MLTNLKRIVVVVGHYGSGKTNFSVNLAVDLKAAGRDVILVDLDIVNPYFRSADFGALLEEKGIGLIAPVYARSNLDVPALDGRLDAVIESDKTLVIDVGGDDAGAAARGRYSAMIREAGGCDVLYVVNAYRYLTRTSEEAAEILGEIERKARLEVTAVSTTPTLRTSRRRTTSFRRRDTLRRRRVGTASPCSARRRGKSSPPRWGRSCPAGRSIRWIFM